MKKLWAPGVFLSIGFLLAGCAGGTSSTQATPSSEAQQNISAATNVDTQATEKVDSMISTSDNVERAYQHLASECMVSKGYPDRKTYYMVETFPVRSLLSPQPLSVEYARNSGYPSPAPPSRYASLEGSINMTEQEGKAYYGDNGKGGCREEAELKLYGSGTLAGTREEITKKLLPYIRASVSNGAYLSLDEEWARCMAERGYTYSSSDIAYEAVRGTPTEQQTAIDDATCREKNNYEEKTGQVLDAYMITFLEKEQGLIEQVTTAKKTAEENARKILS